MVDWKLLSKHMESILKDFNMVNNEFYYENHFLSGLVWIYILSLPIYLVLFFFSTNGWNITFNDTNNGYLMAGLLIVCPYLYKWCMMEYEVLSKSSRYLHEPTTHDLRHVLGLETDSPFQLYLNIVYSVMGAATYAMLVTVSILPLISTISIELIDSLLFVLTIPIWIELVKFIIVLVYIMKQCMLDRLKNPEKLERIF
jgi:hypothetical protein